MNILLNVEFNFKSTYVDLMSVCRKKQTIILHTKIYYEICICLAI